MQDMSSEQRGCVYLLGFIVFAAIFCFFIPFVLLPGWGVAVTLPVITVPAEYYRQDWPSEGFTLVNSLGGALLANIIVLLIAFGVRRASNNWTNEVPGRLQGAVETLVEGLWGFTKQQAGNSPKVKNVLFPIVASLFLFLLAANWGKLLPGVESVGVLHCAVYEPTTFNGHPIHEMQFLGMPYYQLRVDGPLQTGTPATEKSYKQCQALLDEPHYIEDGYLPTELDPWRDDTVTHVTGSGETLESVAEQYLAQADGLMMNELPEGERFAIYSSWHEPEITAESIREANPNLEFDGDALEAGQTIVVRPELFGADATTMGNQLYTVAPFVRGVATDLSFTIGLAIFAFILIQYFGLSTLGVPYLYKFVNTPAIGNIQKNPMGVIDFIVGLFEIVSEFGKIVSLAFRLFGAIFAGTILYAVIMFLTGTTTPVIILALELIVGLAQALVFAVLTLIFCAQAMVSHHHDDHDDEHHDH